MGILPYGKTLHIYFGVNPSTEQRKPWQRATIPTIAAINCLFGEVDAKHFTDGIQGVRSHVNRLDPQPSVTVFSGGGLHCYWLLHAPFVLNDENRDATKRLLYRWVDRVGTDPASKDLCRVLRVPGTRNVKAAYGPDFPVVAFERCDMGALFDPGELAALVPEQERRPREDRPVNAAPSDSWDDRVSQVRLASAGTLHNTLRRVSCNAGWYVAHGVLSEGEATTALTAAAESAGAIDMSNVSKTIASGIEKGRGFYRDRRPLYRSDETWESVDAPVVDWVSPGSVQLASW